MLIVLASVLSFAALFYFPVAAVTSAVFGSLLWQLFTRYRSVLSNMSGVEMNSSSSGLFDRSDESKGLVNRVNFQRINYSLSPRSYNSDRKVERLTDYSLVRVARPQVDNTFESSFTSPPSSQSSFRSRTNLSNTFMSPSISILSRSDNDNMDRSNDRRVVSPLLPPGSYPWIAPFSDSSAKKVITLDSVPVKIRLSKPSSCFPPSPDAPNEDPPEPDTPKQIIQALKELSRKRMHTTESEDESQDGANVPKRRMDMYHNLSASHVGSIDASLQPVPESQENSLMDTSQREANVTENNASPVVQPPTSQISNKRLRPANDSGSQQAKKRNNNSNNNNEILCSLSSSLGILDPNLLQGSPKRKQGEKIPSKRQRVRETSCVEVQTLPSPILKDDRAKDRQDKGTGTDKVEEAPPSTSISRPEITVKKVEGNRAVALLESALMKFRNSGDLIPSPNPSSDVLSKSTSEAPGSVLTPASTAVTSDKPTETQSTFTFGLPQQNAIPVTTAAVTVSSAMTLGTPSPTGDNPGFPTAEKSPPKSDAPLFKFGSSTTTASTLPAPVVASVQQPEAKTIQGTTTVPGGFSFGQTGDKPNFTFGAGPTKPSESGTPASQAAAPNKAAPSLFSFGQNPPAAQVTPTTAAPPTSTAVPTAVTSAPATQTPSKPGGFAFTPTGTFSFGSSTTTTVATTTQSTPSFTFGGSTGAVKADAKSLFGMPQLPTTVATTKPELSTILSSSAGGFNFSASTPATNNAKPVFPVQTTPKTEEKKQNLFSGGFAQKTEAVKPFSFGSTTAASEQKKAPFTFGSGTAASTLGGTNAPPTFGSATSAAPAFGLATGAAPIFGSAASSTPTFGSTTSAAPTFGSTTSVTPTFGSITSATPTFGSTTSATPTFGSATSAAPTFGSAANAAPTFGSSTTNPPMFGTATTTAQFGSSVPTVTATTAMPATFGSNASTFSSAGTGGTFAFGSKPADPAGTGLFGAAPGTATTASLFGSTNTATTAFGSTAAAPLSFGAPTTTTTVAFGQAAASVASTPTFGSLSSTAPAFGSSQSPFNSTAPTFGSASTFGSGSTGFGSTAPTFGSTPAGAPPAPAFGSSSAPAPAFGSGGFGSTPAFGSSATPSFGSTSSAPSFTAPQTQSAAPFNFSAPTATAPAPAPSSGFNFSAPPQPGAKPMFQFGASSATPAATPGAAPFAFGGAPGGAPIAPGGFQNTMFSIGSGSSAPRSRTTLRTRKK